MTDHITGETYAAYIDGQLSDERKETVKSHLEACSACSTEMERFQEIKIRFSRIPKRTAPPELLAKLDRWQEPRVGWLERVRSWIMPQALWWPAGVFAGIVLVSTVVFIKRPSNSDFVDLDSLLVAHSKYQGECLVPHADISQSNYSARLASFYRDQD
jgi:anti-sigma factor RsiW